MGKIFLLISACFLLSCDENRKQFIVFPKDISIDTLNFSSKPNSNIITLQVLIQGNPHQFVFDTGSPISIISSSISSKKMSTDTIFFQDLNKELHHSFRVSLDTLQLGKVKVIQMDSYLQRNLNLDGILGEDIIAELVWKVDLFNRKMYVSRDIANFNINNIGIPIKRKGQFIYIECAINGKELELIIDTGYSGFVSINKKTADSLSNFEEDPIFWEGISTLGIGNPFASLLTSKQVDSTYYFIGNINIGEMQLENEIIELHHRPRNVIGMDFFKRFDYFIIDYPNQKIIFGEVQDKSLDYLISSFMRLNTKGVTFIPSRYKAQIGRINSKAKEAGINYLDTVLSIDGIPVNNRDSSFYQDNSRINEETKFYEYRPSPFLQLWNDFHFLSDTSLIEIKRGDSSRHFTLIREYNFREMPDSLHDYYLDLSLPFPKINRFKTESDNYYFTFKTNELLPPGLRKD